MFQAAGNGQDLASDEVRAGEEEVHGGGEPPHYLATTSADLK